MKLKLEIELSTLKQLNNNMIKYFSFTVFLICNLSCRKDSTPNDSPTTVGQGKYCYYESSHFAPEPILKEVWNYEAMMGPFDTPLGAFYVSRITFNPENANQIIYVKKDSGVVTGTSQIWFYDFCKKDSRKISDDYLYSLNWGIGDKIVYSSSNSQVYMMNSFGEELQQITSSVEAQNAGKFSPDGNLLYITGNDGVKIFDKDGNQLMIYEGLQPYKIIDWFDNERLLVINYETDLCQSLDWENGELINLRPEPQCLECIHVYNSQSKIIYFIEQRGGKTIGLYTFNLVNGHTVFLKELNTSYMFGTGDYSIESKKIIFNLNEVSWKDSIANERYVRQSLIILEENGTNPRIIDLPH